MLKKFSTVLLVIVCVVNVSFGGWVFWTNNEGAGDGLWETTTNWTGYPTSGDDAVIYGDTSGGPTINTGVTGYASWLHLCDTSSTGSKVTVNGGTLAVSDHLLVGEEWGTDQKGTLQVDAGMVNTTLLLCGGGRWGNGGNGTLIVNDGTINISWLLAVGGGYAGVNNGGMGGHIQLDGGLIYLTTGGNAVDQGGLIMSSGGSIDITDGALSLNGVITDITLLANGGSITAYGGTGTFLYDYSVAGRTIVTAIPEPATLVIAALGSLLIRRKK
ncbi:MAG: hypothetical protein LLF92_09425 [Planctomycetaceae bacterium]|nr:hypothetical protein [Planctomycetaceae bacterium]